MDENLYKCIEGIRNNEIKGYRMQRLLEEYYGTDGSDFVWDETGDDDYPKSLREPLEKRTSGIYKALTELLEIGADLNEGDCFNPLMLAVAYADAPLTEWLLKNGADANYWPDKEEDFPYGRNYYYDDLDIKYYNEAWPRSEDYIKALIDTARVLVVEGNLGDYGSICLSIDTESRKISLSGPNYKY